ncbi:MAG TPA: type IX secretion system membrane protein PorP/SprF [Crocinitomicaceae bacterium]|nr:type IX secretion system membrane protein PorP/SprF [Crocinitomicaceae bacterium]
MKNILNLIFGLSLSTFTFGQDLHFAQSNQTPMFINPGAVGVYDGWERVIINHRNQWLGAGTQFMTTAIGADINLGKSRFNDKAHLGLGILFFNDVGGDSKFGNQAGSLTLSGILPMGRSGHVLSIGIQGGVGQRKATLTNVSFMSQWDGERFNPLLSGESNPLVSFNYFDASAGVYYVFNGGQNSFQGNSDFKLKIGVSGFHLNQPKLKYAGGEAEPLYRKYVGHIGIVKEFSGSPFAIDVNGVQFIQSGHNETLLGAMLRYRFENGTKITGHTQKAFFGIGTYYRYKDAIIPSIMIDWRGFQFGISYDVTISELRKAYGGGSLEFSLSFRNLDHSIFKTRKRRF